MKQYVANERGNYNQWCTCTTSVNHEVVLMENYPFVDDEENVAYLLEKCMDPVTIVYQDPIRGNEPIDAPSTCINKALKEMAMIGLKEKFKYTQDDVSYDKCWNLVFFKMVAYAFNGARYDTEFIVQNFDKPWSLYRRPIYGGSIGYLMFSLKANVEDLDPDFRRWYIRNCVENCTTVGSGKLKDVDWSTCGFYVVIEFRDCMKFDIYGSLDSKAKAINTPAPLMKGSFEHEKIKCGADVEKHQAEITNYLLNDVKVEVLWTAVMHRLFYRLSQKRVGQDKVLNINMMEYLTISSISEHYLMQRSLILDSHFGMMCPIDGEQYYDPGQTKSDFTTHEHQDRDRNLGDHEIARHQFAEQESVEIYDTAGSDAENNVYAKGVVTDPPSIRKFVNESKRGAKCEAFRFDVPVNDKFKIKKNDDPHKIWIVLVAGLDPMGTYVHLVDEMLSKMGEKGHSDKVDRIVRDVLNALNENPCGDQCSHRLEGGLWDRYRDSNNYHEFQDIVYNHPHFKSGNWIKYLYAAVKIHYPQVKRKLSQYLAYVGTCKLMKERFEQRHGKEDREDDMFTMVDLNSNYPSTMYLFPFAPNGTTANLGDGECRESDVEVPFTNRGEKYRDRADREAYTRRPYRDKPKKVANVVVREGDEDEVKSLFYKTMHFDDALDGDLWSFLNYKVPYFHCFGIFDVDISWGGMPELEESYSAEEDGDLPFTSVISMRLSNQELLWCFESQEHVKLTNFDLFMAFRQGWRVDVWHSGMVFRGTDTYHQVMKDLYAFRKKLKEDGDPMQITVKLIMNTIYGRSVMKDRPVYKFTECLNERESRIKEGQRINLAGFLNRHKSTRVKKFVTPSQIGVFTLSGARFLMNMLLDSCGLLNHGWKWAKRNNMVVQYTDTDSFLCQYGMYRKLQEKGWIGKEMGQAKREFDVCVYGITVSRKTYALLIMDDGKLDVKIATKGINKPRYYNPLVVVFKSMYDQVDNFRKTAKVTRVPNSDTGEEIKVIEYNDRYENRRDGSLLTQTSERLRCQGVRIKKIRKYCAPTFHKLSVSEDLNTRLPLRKYVYLQPKYVVAEPK